LDQSQTPDQPTAAARCVRLLEVLREAQPIEIGTDIGAPGEAGERENGPNPK